MPDPEALQRFDEIIPNGAERIIRLVETEQAHRMEMDKSTHKIAITGVWLGWVLSIASVLAALYSVAQGAYWPVSTALVGIPIMAVVRALVLRK
ncbi:MAG: DUF2335 domain-containing protein [Candidatus Accumulibacter sp.]|nr:DUF2335 domain-containing protein [Accumulibacter sp.]